MVKDLTDPFGLSPLWEAMLDIYEQFAALCDRHGLRYYVTDGNAIGIVRHQGHFIPWDDDLDVSMPYPDYVKFIEIYQNELPDKYKVVHWRNTPGFDMLFAKIQNVNKSEVLEIESKIGHMLSGGVFIDVFPIYGYDKNVAASYRRRFHYLALTALERFRRCSFVQQTKKGKVGWLMGMCLSPFYPGLRVREDFMAEYESLACEVSYGATTLTGRASLKNRITLVYPHACWGTPTRAMLNGRAAKVPADIDAYLKVEFPDYMTLPPEDKRHPTHEYSYRCPWWLGPTRNNEMR